MRLTTRVLIGVQLGRRRAARSERGDIPGWVMITVMTILVASAILTAFRTQVTTFFNDALSQMNFD